MNTTTPIELHTSDLTASCLRSVQLRHEGKVIGSSPSAMFRGNLIGELFRLCHERDFAPATIMQAANEAKNNCITRAREEHQPITAAVADKMVDLVAEAAELTKWYGERIVPTLGKVLGCELPIRWTVELAGVTVDFASHLDLLCRSDSGALSVYDWKAREESPTKAYLDRNMQLALYYLMVKHGDILLDGEWVGFDEYPTVAWIHANNLQPYKRGGDGYTKGEHRPIDKIVLPCDFTPAKEAAILDELTTRVRMWQAGLFPTNPDPVGCFICSSRTHCTHFGGEYETE